MSARLHSRLPLPATLVTVWLSAIAGPGPVQAQVVEYTKVCTLYGSGFYYIPGTDTCLKIGGKYDSKSIPADASRPAPPAGCRNCAELDKQIAERVNQFNKLEGKGVPKWQEDIASEVARLRDLKTACASVCTPPPVRTTRTETARSDMDGDVRICSPYGASFFYVPGTDECFRISRRIHRLETVPQTVKTPPPPAGCSTCAALDVEISQLQQERAEWAAKNNSDFVADIDSQIGKLTAAKTACQSVCQRRTADKPKSQQPPQRPQAPPQKFGPPIDRGTLH